MPKIALLWLLSMSVSIFFACSEKKSSSEESTSPPAESDSEKDTDKDDSNESNSNDDDEEESSPSSGTKTTNGSITKSWALSKLLEVCNDTYGLVWDPKELTCGQPMTEFPCCLDQIDNDSLLKKVENFMGENDGHKLYNCGQKDATSEVTFYFLKTEGTSYKYSTYKVPAEVISSTNSCSSGATFRSSDDYDEYKNEVDGIGPADEGYESPKDDISGDSDSEKKLDGEALYLANCRVCHFTPKIIQEKSPSLNKVKAQINNDGSMMNEASGLSDLTDEDIEAIIDFVKKSE